MADTKVVPIPHIDRLRTPFRVCIRNATTSFTVLCSKDILQIRSGYFREIIDTKVDEDDVILPEDDPEEASLFLLDIHNLSFAAPHVIGTTKGQDLKWNKVWALLSVKWEIEDYIEAYAQLISHELHSIISSNVQPPSSTKKQRACSMCQRALPVTHSGHNNVWCSYCGAYSNTILVTPNPTTAGLGGNTNQSGTVERFWDMVEVVLCHSCFLRPPLESREDLATVLARHRELWSKEQMIAFLSKEEFFHLCSSL